LKSYNSQGEVEGSWTKNEVRK